MSFRNDFIDEIHSFVERRFTYKITRSYYGGQLTIKSAPSLTITVSRNCQDIRLSMNGRVAHASTLGLSNPLLFSEIEKFICAAPKYKFKAESDGH